jgi:hypothetical protein
MPAFITIPNPQPYPPVTIPQLAPGIPAYMLGLRNDYRYGVGVVHPEALAVGSSLEFSVPSYAGSSDNSPAIQWVVQFPSAPDSVEIHLEGTLDILNGPWFQLAKSILPAGDAQTINMGSAKVTAIRTRVVAASGGTSPTVVSQASI